MPKVLDLSNIGQKKEGQILDLRMPNPSDENLTVKQFVEFNLYNFDQVGIQLKKILQFLQHLDGISNVHKIELDSINTILDAWIKEARLVVKK